MFVRPILNDAELDEVHRLTHEQYVAEGFAAPQPDGRLRHYEDIDAVPENMVLVAVAEDMIIGTVSVTLDGPAGLTVDHAFPAECGAIRAEGPLVGSVWRLITRPGLPASSTLMLELLRSSTDLLERFGVVTVLCEVGPRHERAYGKLFGFAAVARNASLTQLAAPAVLMRTRVAVAAQALPPHDNPALATLSAERRRLLDVLRRAARDGLQRPLRCRCGSDSTGTRRERGGVC